MENLRHNLARLIVNDEAQLEGVLLLTVGHLVERVLLLTVGVGHRLEGVLLHTVTAAWLSFCSTAPTTTN